MKVSHTENSSSEDTGKCYSCAMEAASPYRFTALHHKEIQEKSK